MGGVEDVPWLGGIHLRHSGVGAESYYRCRLCNQRCDRRLAKAFAEKGVRDGVQVNSMLPGAILTQRRRSMLEKVAAQQQITVEAAIERFPEKVGIARLGTPEEIANLLAYLVSPGARWLTGTAIRMDGGEVRGV